jgi:hypothetical protein
MSYWSYYVIGFGRRALLAPVGELIRSMAVDTMRLLLTIFTLGSLLLAGCASRPPDTVSLTILDASTKKEPDMLFIFCEAALDNHTEKDLVVGSHFFSAFDGLSLRVTDDSGRLLAQQAFLIHQSPFTSHDRKFPIHPGRNTHHMPFALSQLTNPPPTLRVQLFGTLPGSAYTGGVTSQVFRVTVR